MVSNYQLSHLRSAWDSNSNLRGGRLYCATIPPLTYYCSTTTCFPICCDTFYFVMNCLFLATSDKNSINKKINDHKTTSNSIMNTREVFHHTSSTSTKHSQCRIFLVLGEFFYIFLCFSVCICQHTVSNFYGIDSILGKLETYSLHSPSPLA